MTTNPEAARKRGQEAPKTAINPFVAMGLPQMDPTFHSHSVLWSVRQEVIPVDKTGSPEELSIFEIMGFPQFDPDIERRTRRSAIRELEAQREVRNKEESIFVLMGIPQMDPDY